MFFRCRFTPFALMASAQACTWTADDYSPGIVPSGESEGTPSVTSMTGAQTMPATNVDATDDPGAGTTAEVPAPGMLVGSDEADGPSASNDDPDSGAPEAPSAPPALPVAALPELIGWASVAGLGLETTTGGGTTPAVLVQTA
jgi:hypothetical protein